MSIILSDISYHYPNQSLLFKGINLAIISGEKASVIGNNGCGKSTLLKLISGELSLFSGSVNCSSCSYYIPQQININQITISQALNVSDKIEALHAIYNGSDNQVLYDLLANDWDIESRCYSALNDWGLPHIELTDSIDILSSGQKTKLFLASLTIHKPSVILLDEPTNHLDWQSREKLYNFICNSKATMLIVSHDIMLLNLLESTYELSSKGIKLYGGNYNFYKQQKEIEDCALEQQINSEQLSLRLARKKIQTVKERQEKRSRFGEKHRDKVPRIMQKGLKNNGEKTISKLKKTHEGIIEESYEKVDELRKEQVSVCELKIDLNNAKLHYGKLLVAISGVNFTYDKGNLLFQLPLNLEIRSGERVHITGNNGSGKTTFIKLLTQELHPSVGEVIQNDFSYLYLDQEHSKIDSSLSVFELAQSYNYQNLLEHEVKLRLHRALFTKDMWEKCCKVLSGGERMRLYLCCLTISNQIPDLFILDEPTNNLDLSSLNILTRTIQHYHGTLLVVSHDQNFISEIGITRSIDLK